jgi:hypothetical protein
MRKRRDGFIEVGEHTGAYYGRSQEGTEVEGNSEKELEA